MRMFSLFLAASLSLAACGPRVPDSRSPAVAATPAPAPNAASTAAQVLGVPTPTAPPAANPDSATGDPLSAINAADGTPQDSASLSDEQNFDAVSSRETIASDAARIEENRAQYVVIEPTQLPPRPDGSGVSIVAYALATTNAPGQALYRRSGIALQARNARNCPKYAAPDQAQEAFLDAGGPKRDRYSLDPEGDGFACDWDPRPFRAARGGAPEVVETYEVVETPGES